MNKIWHIVVVVVTVVLDVVVVVVVVAVEAVVVVVCTLNVLVEGCNMLCERPYIRSGPNGTKKIIPLTDKDARLQVTPFPCGSCLPCRILKAQEWQLRILLEAHVNLTSIFSTLTYSDENLPSNNELSKKHLQLFFKRLRKALYPKRLRFFAVGEYGDSGERAINPHYHVCLFGVNTEDIASIDRSWSRGFTYHGEVNQKSAGYITGYVTKGFKDSYQIGKNGLGERPPEFMTASKGSPGGLGITAIKKIANSILSTGGYDGRPIYNIKYGNRIWPLGRYLTNKLGEYLGTPKENYDINFWAYQTSVVLKHQKKGGIYVEEIAKEYEGKKLSKIKRLELCKGPRKI